jgi:heme oxygenase
MPTPAPDIMLRLRRDTAAIHAATEQLPLMAALLADEGTADDYRRYLSALHGIYLAVEPALYTAVPPTVLEQLGVRPKLPALRRDLAALGAPPAQPAAGWPSRLRAHVSSEPAALGGLYVLEGATLGGRVIARRLRARWRGQARRLPFEFLEFRGADPAGEWRRFSAGVRARVEHWARAGNACDAAVVAGAVALFEAMHQSLREVRPPGR